MRCSKAISYMHSPTESVLGIWDAVEKTPHQTSHPLPLAQPWSQGDPGKSLAPTPISEGVGLSEFCPFQLPNYPPCFFTTCQGQNRKRATVVFFETTKWSSVQVRGKAKAGEEPLLPPQQQGVAPPCQVGGDTILWQEKALRQADATSQCFFLLSTYS